MPENRRPALASRLAFIDCFRGIAILGVLAYHAALEVDHNPLHWRDGFWDWTAFDPIRSAFIVMLQWSSLPTLFFLTSGFVVHFARQKRPDAPLGRFVLRRWVRLFVPYLVVLVLFGVLFPPTVVPLDTRYGLINFVVHLAPVFNLHDETLWSINPSFWYVATELQLCLLYPLLLWAAARVGWQRTLIALFVVQVAAQLGCTVIELGTEGSSEATLGNLWLARSAPSYCLSWALGAWIADRWHSGQLVRPPVSGLVAAALAALFLTVWQPGSVLAMTAVALAGASGLMLLLSRRSEAKAPGRVLASVLWLSRISLAMYLLNQPILHFLQEHVASGFASPLAQLAITFFGGALVVVPLAWVFTQTVETPLCRFVLARIDGWLDRRPYVAPVRPPVRP